MASSARLWPVTSLTPMSDTAPPPATSSLGARVGHVLTDIRAVTDRQAKIALTALVPLSLIAAFFELVGIVLVVPLLSVLSDTGGSGTSIVDWLADLLGTDDRSTLATVLAIAVLVAFVLKTVITLGIRWWSFGAIAQSEARTATRLFDAYLYAPYEFHLQRSSSEAVRNLNESIPIAYQQMLTGVVNLVSEGLLVLAITALVIYATPWAAIGLTAYFVVVGYVYVKVVLRRVPRIGARFQVVSQEHFSLVSQVFGAMKQVIVQNEQPEFAERYEGNRQENARLRQRLAFIGDLPRLYFELAFIVGVVVLTLILVQSERSDRALGILGLLFAAGLRLLPSLNRLFNAFTGIRSGRPALGIVAQTRRDLLTARWEEPEVGDPTDLSGPARLDGVTFGYPNRPTPALQGVTMEIAPGSTVGVVGPSGAGKSTLVDLLLGLYRPQEGSFTAGGVDVTEHLWAWHERVGLVPQDVYLMDTSLRENIAFGRRPDDIDDDAVQRAVEQAELAEFVAGLPEGLATKVGERGVRVSGGQRQRIGIARALYRDPELLVLDEATSALDTITEQRITETVHHLHGRLTIVIVAHRLSTVRRCDQIVFLVDGRVRRIGTFDEVRDAEPEFAALVARSDLGAHEPSPG